MQYCHSHQCIWQLACLLLYVVSIVFVQLKEFFCFVFAFWLSRCLFNLKTVLGLCIKEGHNDSFTLPTVLCCKTSDLLNCAMLGWRKYCCSTSVPSASPDEATEVDSDKEVGCGEQGKRWGGEREEQDVGRSRSHGGLRDLVVEVAHFPWATFTL